MHYTPISTEEDEGHMWFFLWSSDFDLRSRLNWGNQTKWTAKKYNDLHSRPVGGGNVPTGRAATPIKTKEEEQEENLCV